MTNQVYTVMVQAVPTNAGQENWGDMLRTFSGPGDDETKTDKFLLDKKVFENVLHQVVVYCFFVKTLDRSLHLWLFREQLL